MTAPPADASMWLRTSERGTAFALALVMLLCRWFGRAFTRVLIAPAVFYFVLFAPQARRASRDYLARLRSTRTSSASLMSRWIACTSRWASSDCSRSRAPGKST